VVGVRRLLLPRFSVAGRNVPSRLLKVGGASTRSVLKDRSTSLEAGAAVLRDDDTTPKAGRAGFENRRINLAVG